MVEVVAAEFEVDIAEDSSVGRLRTSETRSIFLDNSRALRRRSRDSLMIRVLKFSLK